MSHAESQCSDPAVMADRINKLRAQVICSSSPNISDCAKLMGYSPYSSTERSAALTAASLSGSRVAANEGLKPSKAGGVRMPDPDLKTIRKADAKRIARDDKFRAYINEMPNSHATNVSYEKLVDLGKNRPVIVLGGFSGQGYQNPEKLRAHIKSLMQKAGDKALFVIGGTEGGIGDAYRWIPEIAEELKLKGVETAGIVSRNAAAYGVAKQSYITFVDTPVDSWEVKKGSESLMVSMAKDTKGQLVYFGGGDVSKAEIKEALARGVPVNFAGTLEFPPSIAVAEKKIAKANPGLDRSSPQFQELLDKAMKSANGPSRDILLGTRDNPGLKLIDDGFKNINFQANMAEDLGAKKLLGASIARLGLKALASPYLLAADLMLKIDKTGCSEAVDLYLERDKENGCKAYPTITPKFIEFLNMDTAQQEKILNETPAFCEQTNKLYDQYIENAKFSGVECSANGFTTAKKFSVKTDASNQIVEIAGDPKRGNAANVESVSFDGSGNPKEICYRGARGESCEKKYSIAESSANSIKFKSGEDLYTVENNTLSTLNAYRSNYLAILETASCCQGSDSGRCKKLGVGQTQSNKKKNDSNSSDTKIEGVR